jgi:hypothetical protein
LEESIALGDDGAGFELYGMSPEIKRLTSTIVVGGRPEATRAGGPGGESPAYAG